MDREVGSPVDSSIQLTPGGKHNCFVEQNLLLKQNLSVREPKFCSSLYNFWCTREIPMEFSLSYLSPFTRDIFIFILILSTVSRMPKASVRLSVGMKQLGSLWTEFDEILYFSIFKKSVQKIQVSLKSEKNNGYFTRRRFHIYDDISLNYFYNKKCFRQNL
jgi:hypothetical protein